MLIIMNVIVISLVSLYLIKNRLSSFVFTSGILIIAGGIGNLVDRIFRGYVIDYIDINPIIRYPMFNFADILVVIGCLVIAIDLIISIFNERKENR